MHFDYRFSRTISLLHLLLMPIGWTLNSNPIRASQTLATRTTRVHLLFTASLARQSVELLMQQFQLYTISL